MGTSQGPFNFAMSAGAMVLSAVTLYLSYFDQRYALTAAMVDVEATVHRAGGSSEGVSEAYFQYYVLPSFILSQRGTRPLVLTDIALVRSTDRDACVAGETEAEPIGKFEATMLEPGTLRTVAIEYGLGAIEATNTGAGYDLDPRSDLWCFKLTLFDGKGRRMEPLLPAFGIETTFGQPTPEDELPTTEIDIDVPEGAVTVTAKGRRR